MSNDGETKTKATDSPNAENDSILAKLVYPVAADDTPPYELIAWWKIIFSCLDLEKKEQQELRWVCRIFRDALPCLPLWTSFPHPMYPTLTGLMGRLNHLGNDYVKIKAANMSIGLIVYVDRNGTYKNHTITKINPDGTYNTTERNNVPLTKFKQKVVHILPSLLFIARGVHDEGGEHVYINIPISIIGESREHCIVMGGLAMRGKEEDNVNVSNLTLRESKGEGVYGEGASFHLDNVSVENSGGRGVSVWSTKRNSMKNCNVSHSKYSGVHVWNGLMTIDGNATTIHHNCTDGDSRHYGLHTFDFSSSIHLASSLTIETISKNNGGGGNYGGSGTIKTITNNTKEEKK
jgi:hypothetical protein